MNKTLSLILSSALLPVLAFAAQETYRIDPVHSGVSFSIRHFFTKVPGSFGTFSGELVFDKENLANTVATGEIDVASVNTHNADRDKHLMNDDFFSADRFPKMTFRSTNWKALGENQYEVLGDLTIRDVTKPVTLAVQLLGMGEGMGGKQISGWDASVTIDRREWGITYGQGVVGNEVEITLNIQGHLVP